MALVASQQLHMTQTPPTVRCVVWVASYVLVLPDFGSGLACGLFSSCVADFGSWLRDFARILNG